MADPPISAPATPPAVRQQRGFRDELDRDVPARGAAVHGTTVVARSRPGGGLDVEVTLAARAPAMPGEPALLS